MWSTGPIRKVRLAVRAIPVIGPALGRLRHGVRRSILRLLRGLPASWSFGPPRAWFSLYEELRSGRVPGRVILERQPPPNIAEPSLRRLAPLGQDRDYPQPIFWTRHRNAELVGPTLLLRNARNEVAVESGHGPAFIADDPGFQQLRRPAAVHLDGRWTSLISRWGETFHHWMFDALPQLAVLPEFPADIQVLVPARLHPYQVDTLAWLGLEGRYRPTAEQHLLIDDFYFSSPTAPTGCFNPYAVTFLRKAFLKHADAAYDAPKRFYIQRVGVSRQVRNESEVLALLRQRGWAVLDMVQLTLAQQIQLFAGAEMICATHGAALTNLVFCSPRTRVIELVPVNFLNGVYEGVCEAAGLDYEFLVCQADAEARTRIDVVELAKRLPR